MKKITVFSLLALVLFLSAQKVGIELSQNGFGRAGSYFVVTSHVLKAVFLVSLIVLLLKSIRRSAKNLALQILVGFLCIPIFFVSCTATMFSGRIINNLSRPTRPGHFIKDQASVQKLTDLANEMIQKKKVFWIGNGWDGFIFSIRYSDGDYQFDSRLIPDNCDFSKPVKAEDMSKVRHYDLPFQSDALQPTDEKTLDPEDYAFCRDASKIIRKIGFDNVKLYDEQNVVQFQIYDFIGWDNGGYFVYYFCPDTALPGKFEYDRKLNENWYYIWHSRFTSPSTEN